MNEVTASPIVPGEGAEPAVYRLRERSPFARLGWCRLDNDNFFNMATGVAVEFRPMTHWVNGFEVRKPGSLKAHVVASGYRTVYLEAQAYALREALLDAVNDSGGDYTGTGRDGEEDEDEQG